jgi:hypothetical protein
LSPIALIALGGGPIHAMPESMTSWAKSAFSARNPKPGWIASAPPDRAAATTAARIEEVERVLAAGRGTMARMPSASHVRVMRCAISPRLAMKTVEMRWLGLVRLL